MSRGGWGLGRVASVLLVLLFTFSLIAFAPPPPSDPLDILDQGYGGGHIPIGATSTVQKITLSDTQNDAQDIHITKIVVALGGASTATAFDIMSVRVWTNSDGLDVSATVSSFPVTVCSGINYVIADGGSDTLWIEVTVAGSATYGHVLQPQTWLFYHEGAEGDTYSGFATDGAPETLGEGSPPTAAVFRVTAEGDVLADGAYYGEAFYTGAADIAEWVDVSEPVAPGDVLELDPEHPGYYRKARGRCSTLVAGVVSTNPGFILGAKTPSSSVSGSELWTMDLGPWTEGSGLITDDSRLTTPDRALLALIGIIPVKVTDEGGPIRPGDLLVSSSTSGYAMRWDQESDLPVYSFVGKALEPLTDESGLILVLLMAH